MNAIRHIEPDDLQAQPSIGVTFVANAIQCFEAAAAAAGCIERWVAFGKLTIRLRFAGPVLQKLFMPAIAHAEVLPGKDPALTVCFFDSESTGTPMAAAPWPKEEFTNTGDIHCVNDDRVHVNYHLGTHILQCIDRGSRTAIYWTPSFGLIPYWERSFPLRAILNWHLKSTAIQPAHAGAVGTAAGGLLITGPSGSGKSTTTLACLGSPLLYAGDDYVLVCLDGQPYVHCLYSTAKLEPHNAWRFPHLARLISNRDRLGEEKALLYLHEAMPDRICSGFPIRAIVRPRVTGLRDSRLVPENAASGLVALAPTTTRHLTGTRHEIFLKLLRLSRSVPCYTLEAGTDLSQIPDVLTQALR